jgi:hypothetical protein
VIGPTHGAIGVESMLTQAIDRSGERATLGVRGGLEGELLPNRLQIRLGSYLEPTRFRPAPDPNDPTGMALTRPAPRIHATGGFEARVLDWSVWGLFPEDNSFRISGALDVAPGRDYYGWSLGIGTWY